MVTEKITDIDKMVLIIEHSSKIETMKKLKKILNYNKKHKNVVFFNKIKPILRFLFCFIIYFFTISILQNRIILFSNLQTSQIILVFVQRKD